MRIREDIEWDVVARDTYRWMKKTGFVHDAKKHQRSHMIVDDWTRQFGLDYGVVADDWGACLVEMTRLGYLIGFDPGRGFYLTSDASDAATAATRLINAAISLLGYAERIMTAQTESGDFESILPGYKGRIRLADFNGVMPLLKAANRTTDAIELALLEAKNATRN